MRNVSYVKIGSGNAEATSRFFERLFSWTLRPMRTSDGGGWFETGDSRIGLHGNDPNWGIVPNSRVENIQAAAAGFARSVARHPNISTKS